MPDRCFSMAGLEGQRKHGLVGFILSLVGQRERRRARISDLPANLRRDIGLDPIAWHGSSFEQRWQDEIDRIQRR